MPALSSGTIAPNFSLYDMNGKTFSLRDALAEVPLVLAFFKISCPTCQYTFPFLERIHKAFGGEFRIIGISQNDKKDTAAFIKEYGVTFPVLLDDTKKYPVSNAYGLTNVPTIFWVAEDGTIEMSSVGWDKQDIENIYRKAAELVERKPAPLFHRDEHVEAFRAG